MITTCTECLARYQLEDDKIPHKVIRVRCPACQGIFSLDGTSLGQSEPALVIDRGGFNQFGPAPVPEVPRRAAASPAPAVARGPELRETPTAVLDRAQADTEESGARSGRRRRSKEEMYARALVSDILAYNRETRDKALAEGKLVEALGAEIKKSWELYKEKVTPEVANSTDHFRQALNDILSGGKSIF